MKGADRELERHDELLIPAGSESVAATRYHPLGTDSPLPVVLVSYPYRKDDLIDFGRQNESLRFLAKSGYEVVICDIVGTGASTGRAEKWFGDERESLIKVIEWLSDRNWSTGDVGMYGISWGGMTQLRAAAERPEALKAIVPVAVGQSIYGTMYPGGVFDMLRFPTWATQMLAYQSLPPSRRDTNGRWARVWNDRLDDIDRSVPWLFRWLENGTENRFWDEQAVNVERIEVPTFYACGYRDIHTRQMLEYFDVIDAPKRFLLGPWRHVQPHRGRESAVDFRRQAVEWFDHFLKGIENGVTDHPTFEYWTERDGGWNVGGGRWRGSNSWPPRGMEDVSFALSGRGLVREEAFDDGDWIEEEYQPDASVGIDSLQRVGSVATGGGDTNPDDVRSCTFETDALEDPIELTGDGHVDLRVRASTPDPVIVGRIVDVAPGGDAKPVTQGYLRASHKDGHRNPEEITPGDEIAVRVPLNSRSHVFEEGHRIRFGLSACLFPKAFASPDAGPLTILSTPAEPSTVTFPGRTHEGRVEFDDVIDMSPPDDASIPTDSEHLVSTSEDVSVNRSQDAGTAELTATSRSTVDLPHASHIEKRSELVASVDEGDPRSSNVKNRTELSLAYANEDVTVEASSLVNYAFATLSVEVTNDGATVYENRWRRDW